jgi:hypothetical protein
MTSPQGMLAGIVGGSHPVKRASIIATASLAIWEAPPPNG